VKRSLVSFAALALFGCSPYAGSQALCETACGMRLLGEFPARGAWPEDAPSWSCEWFQAIEDGVVKSFPRANDDRLKNTCRMLSGWTVSLEESETWKDSRYAYRLSGYTACGAAGYTRVGNSPPDRSSLPHELAHVAQDCYANTCAHPGTDSEHSCWVENGIYLAAANANLEAARIMKDGGP